MEQFLSVHLLAVFFALVTIEICFTRIANYTDSKNKIACYVYFFQTKTLDHRSSNMIELLKLFALIFNQYQFNI